MRLENRVTKLEAAFRPVTPKRFLMCLLIYPDQTAFPTWDAWWTVCQLARETDEMDPITDATDAPYQRFYFRFSVSDRKWVRQ